MHNRVVRMPRRSPDAGATNVAQDRAVDPSPPFGFDYTLCWPYIVAGLGPDDERPVDHSASVTWRFASINVANCAYVIAMSLMRKNPIRFFWTGP